MTKPEKPAKKKRVKTLYANTICLTNREGKRRIVLDASNDKYSNIEILNDQGTCIQLIVVHSVNEASVGIFNSVSLDGKANQGGR